MLHFLTLTNALLHGHQLYSGRKHVLYQGKYIQIPSTNIAYCHLVANSQMVAPLALLNLFLGFVPLWPYANGHLFPPPSWVDPLVSFPYLAPNSLMFPLCPTLVNLALWGWVCGSLVCVPRGLATFSSLFLFWFFLPGGLFGLWGVGPRLPYLLSPFVLPLGVNFVALWLPLAIEKKPSKSKLLMVSLPRKWGRTIHK